ncbi:hypothetical protein BDV37DRAFT_246519 [Aspergillus pseudonomiae]|uniref:NAD-dependent epimerase/dehydratase domain-containing protein n=1 Tax=Aspergillus pseudonomiae TaxID=1506151 RepID=A0A5N7DEQ3_9EURO|nr:uncharacterized protein BDV37DRAFT_246519 [Aspergillus pseudonomiae]KAE8404892.1 hypothetical protein BDV37DRAFT_246519 [Aspergillus pseudonomiae]
MRVLVIGGTGTIGGHAALHLQSLGHDVSIAGRRPPPETTALVRLPYIQGDFVRDTFTTDQLTDFDAVVFAAGHDIRHTPPGENFDEHVLHVNGEAVPRFARLARDAGVKRFVYIGSFYPHIAEASIDSNAYVRSRKLATDGILGLAGEEFIACALEAPFVVGIVPGMSTPVFEAYIRYAKGELGIPFFGPRGGSNFMSTQSLSEAIAGALVHGEPGKAYLLGDENLSFASYFQIFFDAVGNSMTLPSLDQEHPLLPDAVIYSGRGNMVSYEPDPADVERLGYRRHDVSRAVGEIVSLI